MLWRDFLASKAKELSESLKFDTQYFSFSESDIFQIAYKELEKYIIHNKSWTANELILKAKKKISLIDQKNIEKFIQKRKKGVPLSYIIGWQDFYGLSFKVNKHTLIPRPETEELVAYALDKIYKFKNKNIILCDIGTGSGCIITAFLKNLSKNIVPKEIFAVDRSQKSLEIADYNVSSHLKNHNKVKMIKSSLLTWMFDSSFPQDAVVFILANLPYLSRQEYLSLSKEVANYEPKSALVGGLEGSELILKLLKQALEKKRCCPKLDFQIFLEISPSILPAIQKICLQNKILFEIKKDLSKKDRIVQLTF